MNTTTLSAAALDGKASGARSVEAASDLTSALFIAVRRSLESCRDPSQLRIALAWQRQQDER